MIPLSLLEVARVVGGDLVDVADGQQMVTGAVTSDSRSVQPGGLFVAIAGERVDGHDYVDEAVRAGTVAALTSRPVGRPAVVVADVVAALGRLATHVLTLLPAVTVVGITGSSGKTSTKDLVAQLASRVGPTVAPHGSYNTEVGLPLTVLQADENTRVLVLEMGARGSNHVAYLCGVAQPDIGVVLNVGSAHVGEFGSAEAIAAAKAELVQHTKPTGVVVLNDDDPRVAAMAAVAPARVVRFGRGGRCEVRAEDVRPTGAGRYTFTLHTPDGQARVSLQLVGAHQVDNALAAAAVGAVLGLGVRDLAETLTQAVPVSRWRMEIGERSDGVTVINDAYNANPESTAVALRALVDVADGRRTWAVLGEMRELGARHEDEHVAVGRLAAELGVDRIVVVGPGAAAVIRGAHLGGSATGPTVDHVAGVDAAGAFLLREVRPDDVVLVKASRAVGLEQVADALLAVGSEGGGDSA